MTHWGWYWKIKKKHIPKNLCSKMVTIDSFKLLRDNKAGFSVQPLDINAMILNDHLQITYGKHTKSSYAIPIDKQACNYGGFRYFFRCPLCQKRARLLYFAEQSVFLCRKCLNLGYLSQRLRPSQRYSYMSRKIQDNIEDKRNAVSQCEKSSRMHSDNYQRLKDKQLCYEHKSHQALNKELREWYGAKAEPYLEII